jgi:hypothetical protein
MMQSLKREWREFLKSKPGRRFHEVHERRQKKRGNRQGWKKGALIAAGWVLILVGTLLLALPGPGLLVLAAGLMLLASESLSMARFLDWADKKGHEWWKGMKGQKSEIRNQKAEGGRRKAREGRG